MNKNTKRAVEFLRSKKGYLKTGDDRLALMLGITPKEVKIAKKAVKIEFETKDAVKTAEQIIETTEKTVKKSFKRLFWDIETSPNIVFSWNVGPKVNLGHESIIQERAIICICYKWAGESKVHSLHWDKGDDKNMIIEFMKVLESADESVGHNSDSFDLKWLRSRCIYHKIPAFPVYQTVDTLKLARTGFRFNSNRLDYLGKFFGYGGKADTGGFNTWKSIVLDNDEDAMNTMVKYCKMDVIRLEQIFDRLNPYTLSKTHVGVLLGHDKSTCPNCGGNRTISKGYRYSRAGTKKHCRLCLDCGKGFTLPGIISVVD